MSSLRTRIRPDVSTSSIGGQRLRIACASRNPSMLPGILMSVKTIRMSTRASRIAMASSAVPAWSTPKPASSRRDTAFIRTKNSSSTTSTSSGAIKTPKTTRAAYIEAHRTNVGSDHLLLALCRIMCSELHSTNRSVHPGEQPPAANSSTAFSRLVRHWPHDLLCRFVLTLLPFPGSLRGPRKTSSNRLSIERRTARQSAKLACG